MRPPDYRDDEGSPHYLSDGETDPLIVSSWRVRDPRRRSGWRELRWKMTPAEADQWARANGAEVETVPGSEEVRFPGADGRGMPPG